MIDIDTGGILQLVVEGKMRAYHDDATPFQLNGLLFSEEDIAATIEGIKADHGLCTRVEAARRLGVKHTTLKKWCDAGLLRMVPHGTTTYVTEDELRCFEDRYVFAEDAAQRLGITVHTLYQWMRNGRLEAVEGNDTTDWHRLLFRRDDIAGLQPRGVVSGPELARRLGVSRATIYRWTQEGRLQPVSGPGVDDTGRYLYDVTDLPDEIASE